ncbi:MAG: TetR/AcrR family transcriptional regulator [Flavobacteriales bacterium]|jgi:AcrR family transcriptional regulator|nr:TetR/AcrR family transcriptional regulator [Flavobacteriales bacterium]MCW8912359.1 TetR/AcrR family transcriptional regulator [Flavobacteriales bacterium]MCW8938568.1 TetR/AcrR family transcriptional regulator [Flavobacteriales bacterium]MCW8939443.1 TetR/AcrR family transcriptional regulator [Flavobacteriales bacterium]MCW8967509.1 TetR/AcrR family transcriptional regulator [Flavobacteriales bacterium]
MKQLLSSVNIKVNENVYLKNPESSELGKKIIAGSIDLINEMGFEAFTFKKLGQAIGSTEASIYRYFESKHKLLLYLNCWYWSWTEYKMMFGLANILSPVERLRKAILLLTQEAGEDNSFMHINELKLNQIVISESSKAYLTKEVDQDNKLGAYAVQKQLVQRVSDIILEINPTYKYPHMLISTVIEGAHLQRYFAEHLPRLTDTSDKDDYITAFYTELVFKAIEK